MKKGKGARIVSLVLGAMANFIFIQILFFIQLNSIVYSKDSTHYRAPSYNEMSTCALAHFWKKYSH